MAHKGRPFTRRQRSKALERRRIEERQDRRASRVESKAYQQELGIFRGCDPDRTERLADGR